MEPKEFYKEFEPDDNDLEEIARQIKEGFTSGRLDLTDAIGKNRYIYWELNINSWIEED